MGATDSVGDKVTSPESEKLKTPQVAPSLYPPPLMLSDADFAALQQRKRALGEYAMKAFAADKRTDTEAK